MKYNSIREYFYKLHNLLYAFILLPLLVFVVLYWQIQEGNLSGPFYLDTMVTQILIALMGAVIFTDWVISLLLFNRGLKSIRKIQSLGERLDRYFSLTVLRFAIILSGSIALAIGFFLTESQMFTIIAVSNVLLVLLLWPRPAKVCGDLQLKGDERTLVLYKKDRLH